VLRRLQEEMGNAYRFWGYDISPQAMDRYKSRANEEL